MAIETAQNPGWVSQEKLIEWNKGIPWHSGKSDKIPSIWPKDVHFGSIVFDENLGLCQKFDKKISTPLKTHTNYGYIVTTQRGLQEYKLYCWEISMSLDARKEYFCREYKIEDYFGHLTFATIDTILNNFDNLPIFNKLPCKNFTDLQRIRDGNPKEFNKKFIELYENQNDSSVFLAGEFQLLEAGEIAMLSVMRAITTQQMAESGHYLPNVNEVLDILNYLIKGRKIKDFDVFSKLLQKEPVDPDISYGFMDDLFATYMSDKAHKDHARNKYLNDAANRRFKG